MIKTDPKERNEFASFDDRPDNDGFKIDEARVATPRDWGDDEQIEEEDLDYSPNEDF